MKKLSAMVCMSGVCICVSLWRGMPALPFESNLLAGTVQSLLVTPGSVVFTATDPDVPAVGPSSSAATWNIASGSPSKNWQITVQASTSSLTNCPRVPVSAIRANCTGASVSGSGGSATCAPAFNLSITPQILASGKQALNTASYSTNLELSFTDGWGYPAATSPPCSISLTYTVIAQ